MPGVPRRMSMDPDAAQKKGGSNPGSRHASRPSSLEMSIAEDSAEDDREEVFHEQETEA